MLDRCGCCLECARSEGQLCDLEPPGSRVYGTCGENLQCLRRSDTVRETARWNSVIPSVS